MSDRGVLVIDPPGGAPNAFDRAWLVCIPHDQTVTPYVVASYMGNVVPTNRLSEETELAICLANFEGHGFKRRISHCVVVSNMGISSAQTTLAAVGERWPHVLCAAMSHTAADGKVEHEWPVAFAQRCLLQPEVFVRTGEDQSVDE